MAEAKLVTVLNRGRRSYHLTDGRILGPGEGLTVSADEAKSLQNYREVVDASKLVKVPQNDEAVKKLKKENDELAKENAELKKGKK